MKKILIALLSIVFSCTLQAKDRLEVYKDYDLGTEIMTVTTVKVDPNMGDVYLAGLQNSWVKAVKIQKELGYIKDWKIYGSDLPNSGDFNMLLVVTFNNSADLEPNKKKYDPRVWIREAEKSFVERLKVAFADLSCVGEDS